MSHYARDSFAAGLGPIEISDDPAVLESFAGDISFTPSRSPALVIYPQTRQDVQEIGRQASKTGIPLTPVSSGPPHFRGDTVPNSGGVVVDFGRMKRILKIDTVNRYAMIEPGVTYGELIPALKEQGMRLNLPFLPRASKSVVTSRLEREANLIPKYQYDFTDPLLTLEVVYGTGDDFRTGSACGPGTIETLKADKVNPWGPGSIDYFRFISGAQGTMGLVTWAITKTEVLPTAQKLYFLTSNADSGIQRLIPLIDEFLRRRVVDECLVLNKVSLATMLAEKWPDEFHGLMARVPDWVAILCVAGYARRSEERLALHEEILKEICQDFGQEASSSLEGAEGREGEILYLLSNPWERTTDWKLRTKGSSREIFFLAPLSKIPHLIYVMKARIEQSNYPADLLSCYVQPMVQGRGCHCEFILPVDESDKREVETVRKLFSGASLALLENGAFFSRPYGLWSKLVYDRYPEGVAALQKLKGIFDPQGVLNPGKLCF